MLPDEDNKIQPEDESSPEGKMTPVQGEDDIPKRKKVRIKVRKKIRIKKKPSAKKLMRKIGERVFWTLIIAGFITSLIIMVVQLDIRDEKYKKQLKKATPTKSR